MPAVEAARTPPLDVVSTLRAGSVRSVADRMTRLSGDAPERTIPDSALLPADEVELVAGASVPEQVALAEAWITSGPRTVPTVVGALQVRPRRVFVASGGGADGDRTIERAVALAAALPASLVGAALGGDRTESLVRQRELLEAAGADITDVDAADPLTAVLRLAVAHDADAVIAANREPWTELPSTSPQTGSTPT